jgi:hypothetical protein
MLFGYADEARPRDGMDEIDVRLDVVERRQREIDARLRLLERQADIRGYRGQE